MISINKNYKTFSDLLLHTTDKYPSNVYIKTISEEFTYEEVAEKVMKVAYVLKENGISRGDRVAIILNNGIKSVVSMFAVMTVGAAYVCIDSNSPKERLIRIIKECDIKCIITDDTRANVIKNLSDINVSFFLGYAHPEKYSISWREVELISPPAGVGINVSEDDLSFIYYTSGSTGIPKGISHTHRSGLWFPTWSANQFQVTDKDRIANVASHHFAASINEIYTSVIEGARTVVIPQEIVKFPMNIAKIVEQEQISIFLPVPYILGKLLEGEILNKCDFSSVRVMIVHGEKFSIIKLKNLMNKIPDTNFYHLYASSEALPMFIYKIPKDLGEEQSSIPLGNTCQHVTMKLVDTDLKPVADKETGEIIIHSPSLMKGYWGREDLNDNVFVYPESKAMPFFRTGDLARKGEDGNVYLVGRKDRIIKLRGLRIDLDEIELELLNHPSIQMAAVYLIKGQHEEQIECAVVLEKDQNMTDVEVSTYLRGKLPLYAQPEIIKILEDLPRTPTDKIDRKKLAEKVMK